MPPAIVLLEPDIPQNTGAIIRLCATIGWSLHLIEPFGFVWNEKKLKRGGLDYIDHCDYHRHLDIDHFERTQQPKRLVLFTTKGMAIESLNLADDDYDYWLFGNESSGAPPSVHRSIATKVRIPMVAGVRSMNLATSIAWAMGYYYGSTQTGSNSQRGNNHE